MKKLRDPVKPGWLEKNPILGVGTPESASKGGTKKKLNKVIKDMKVELNWKTSK